MSLWWDRVKFATSTAGLGAMVVGSAVTGFRTPAQAGVPDGTTISYVVEEGNAWEIGQGVYSGGSLTRTLRASSTGSLIALAGRAKVVVTTAATELNDMRALRTDLSASTGATQIGGVRTATGAAAFSLARVLNDRPQQLEDYSGGPSASAAANDAAIVQAVANLPAQGGVIQLAKGAHNISNDFSLGLVAYNVTIRGDQSEGSYLQQTSLNKNVISVPAAAICHTVKIENLLLRGAGFSGGTGHGLYIPNNLGGDTWGWNVRNVSIANVPGKGIYSPIGGSTSLFSSTFEDIRIDFVGDHGVDLGGLTTTLVNVYVANLSGTNKAAYRFHGASPTLIGCNGVDTGDYWGIFGDKTTLGDASDNTCNPILIGCNVEAYAKVGIQLRNGSLNWISGTGYAAATGSGIKAIEIYSQTGISYLGDPDRMLQTLGGTFANGRAIHSNNGFLLLDMPYHPSTSLPYYDDGAGADRTISTRDIATLSGTLDAQAFKYLYNTGVMRRANAGTTTMTGAATKTVSLPVQMPSSSYTVTLGPQIGEKFWVTGQTSSQFTLNSDNATSTGKCSWAVEV